MTEQKASKKKNRRSKVKHNALNPQYNLKRRAEIIKDFDYLKKLNKQELEFLNKFVEEYMIDKLDRKNLDNNLHNTQALKKDCDDRNNARNRDLITVGRLKGEIVELEVMNPNLLVKEDIENKLIQQIDLEKMLKDFDNRGRKPRQ